MCRSEERRFHARLTHAWVRFYSLASGIPLVGRFHLDGGLHVHYVVVVFGAFDDGQGLGVGVAAVELVHPV